MEKEHVNQSHGRPTAYYRTLTRNLVLFVVVVSLVPLMFSGAIILYEF